MKALSFGEILWDVYADKKYIGGASLNFAAHLARHGEESYLLSCVGEDGLGDEALLHLNEIHVFTDYVSRSNTKDTGMCLVTLDKNAIPSYDLKQDVAYDYIDCDKVKEDFDILYFGTLALRNNYNLDSLGELLKRKRFCEVFVDINMRAPFYSYESVSFSMRNTTILKVSSEELPIVADILSIDKAVDYKVFAKLLKERYSNIKLIIITLGAEGAYCYDCVNGQTYYSDSQKVDVVSTVGAGDSFSAAFLHQYFLKKDLQYCLEYASGIAGFVVSKMEAVPNYNATDFSLMGGTGI